VGQRHGLCHGTEKSINAGVRMVSLQTNVRKRLSVLPLYKRSNNTKSYNTMKTNTKEEERDFSCFREYDVLCGRGNGLSRNAGNSHFRVLVDANRKQYNSTRRTEKINIARMIFNKISAKGGRFLILEDGNQWVEVTRARAVEKCCQALREQVKSYKTYYNDQNENGTMKELKSNSNGSNSKSSKSNSSKSSSSRNKVSKSSSSELETKSPASSSKTPAISSSLVVLMTDSSEDWNKKATILKKTPPIFSPSISAAPKHRLMLSRGPPLIEANKPPQDLPPTTANAAKLKPTKPKTNKTPRRVVPIPSPPTNSNRAGGSSANNSCKEEWMKVTMRDTARHDLDEIRQMLESSPSSNRGHKRKHKLDRPLPHPDHHLQQLQAHPRPSNQAQSSLKNPSNPHDSGNLKDPPSYSISNVANTENEQHQHPAIKIWKQYTNPSLAVWSSSPSSSSSSSSSPPPAASHWNEMYAALELFYATFGHCGVPPNWAGHTGLADWTACQRHIYREIRQGYRPATSLEQSRLQLLQNIQFPLDCQSYEEWHWKQRHQELECILKSLKEDQPSTIYYNVHYLCSKLPPSLAVWLEEQRNSYRMGVLPERRHATLENMGILWEPERFAIAPEDDFLYI
jgi:Helicase associated domain